MFESLAQTSARDEMAMVVKQMNRWKSESFDSLGRYVIHWKDALVRK